MDKVQNKESSDTRPSPKTFGEELKEREHFGDLCIDGRIILKYIFKIQGVRN
jgi:hypothetical protein